MLSLKTPISEAKSSRSVILVFFVCTNGLSGMLTLTFHASGACSAARIRIASEIAMTSAVILMLKRKVHARLRMTALHKIVVRMHAGGDRP